MSEHVHDWHFDAFGDGIIAMCVSRDCEMELTAAEVSRRLNATGRLGAEDALMAAHTGKDNGLTEREVGRLRAYAAALEGEDG